jgi:hypothetical protein
MENISFVIIILWIALFGIFDTLISFFNKVHHKLISYIIIAIVSIILIISNDNNYSFVL